MSIAEENEILVSRIRNLCQACGQTVKELEKNLGFSNGVIGKWATAAKRPPFDRISAVASYFGVTVSFLRGEAEQPTPGDGDGLSLKGRMAAILFEQAEPWLQDQVLALLKAAAEGHEAQGNASSNK